MAKLRIGFYYQHLYKEGGYPRDLRWLLNALNSLDQNEILVTPITSIKEFYLKRKTIDVLHIFGFFMFDSLFLALESKRFGLPYIFSPLGALLPLALKRKSQTKKRLCISLVGQYLLRNSSILHVFTDNEEKGIRALGVDTPVFQAPWGILGYHSDSEEEVHLKEQPSLEVLAPKALVHRPYLLFVGRLDIRWKGIDIMLDGFNKYIKSGGRFNLIICGRDWEGGKSYIQDRLSSFNSDRFIFFGEVDQQTMHVLIQCSKAFVYPTRHDGPPRPIRHALHLGKRILITKEANIHNDIESLGWGYFFEPTSNSFVSAIQKLEENNDPKEYIDPTNILSWDNTAHSFCNGYLSIRV